MKRLVLAAWLLGTAPAATRADPCSNEIVSEENGGGGSLLPAANDDIRMESERVELTEPKVRLDPDGQFRFAETWTVHARYSFRNVTDRAVELRMDFPMNGVDAYCRVCERGSGDCQPGYMESPVAEGALAVTVRGEPVATTFHSNMVCDHARCTTPCREQGCYDFGFLFQVAFGPGESVAVELDYQQRPSFGSWQYLWRDLSLPFILRTGALWNGPIGALQLVYRLAVPPTTDPFLARPFRPGRATVTLWDTVPFHYDVACDSGGTLLTLTAENVVPAGDVVLTLLTPGIRILNLERRGCTAYTGWNPPDADCCSYLDRPSLPCRTGSGPAGHTPYSTSSPPSAARSPNRSSAGRTSVLPL